MVLLLACAPPEDAAVVAFDPSTPDFPTGQLIGWNLGRGTLYGPAGDDGADWRTPERVEAIARLGQVRGFEDPLVRFSGLQIDGTLGGDGYHFQDYVDGSDQNMSPSQYMTLIDEADSRPIVTLNFGSGTVDEAAAYAAHVSASWDPAFYEIGNEVFAVWNTGYSAGYEHSYANPNAPHGGDPDWHGRPSQNADDFNDRALAYVEAVQAVDPDAQFLVPLTMADFEAWGGMDAAVDALTPLLSHDAVAAAVVHHYQVDDARTLGHDGLNDPELIMGASQVFRPHYQDLRQRLDALGTGMAVTEYHVAGFFAGDEFELVDEAVLGLGIADMLLLYAQLGLDVGNQHLALDFDANAELLFEPWYNPFRAVDGQIVDMPGYTVTRLFAQHLLEQTVLVDLDDPTLEAVAFSNDTQATMLVLNRDMDGPRMLWVESDAGVVQAQAFATPAWDHDAAAQPLDVQPVAVSTRRGTARVELAPMSLTALRFER